MDRVKRIFLGVFLSLFSIFCLCFQSVKSLPLFMTTGFDIENDQTSIDPKSIDDLLGPDTNFPFDPANHRDGSNPIKRIGKISDDNL